jgi:endonuclease YncB( thermonuclease family)
MGALVLAAVLGAVGMQLALSGVPPQVRNVLPPSVASFSLPVALPVLPSISVPSIRLSAYTPVTSHKRYFRICSGESPVTCVADGDTIWLDKRRIRLAGIDAPEVIAPACPHELAKGQEAARRLAALLNEGTFELVRTGYRNRDVQGSELRDIQREGVSLGTILISEGLALNHARTATDWCG